ncbi:MAG: NACHT domain-containing protein [Sphingorhabdus sp.]|uniref:NACHT domain-containing protein n=1 Tax=Sphingorhabdus sp. TaxID=1902408 RepID=UPI0038FCE6CF
MAAGVDDLAINLVASAMFEGIRRPIQTLRSHDVRRQEIISAIEGKSGTPAAEKRTDGAFDDLVRVLGNKYGEYTHQVDRFLLELRTSAVPSALYGSIVAGKSAEFIRPAFDSIYTTFSPLPFTMVALFDALSAAIRARIDTASSDPMLMEVIRASSDELRHEIIEISEALNKAGRSQPLTSEQFLDIRSRVARSIETEHRDLPVETDRGTRRVNISKLVIPARLSPVSSHALTGGGARPDSATIPLSDFRRGLHRGVVLGDPGGGKSTLTQLVCYEMARSLNLDVLGNPKHIDDRDLRLPLRIVVRTLDRIQRSTAGYTVLDYLRDEIKIILDNDGEIAERFLIQVLTTGKAILLFDGLDEILEVSRRRQMTTYIEQFINNYAACPALVTSRIVGYNDAPLSDEFGVFLLAKLQSDEIQKYAEKLIKAISSAGAKSKDRAISFVKQTEATASDLRENPLLLGLMVYIFMERGDVPDNRPAIYQACSQLLFMKWDQRREILFEYPDDFELLDLFGFLAVKIFGDPDVEDGVSDKWLLGHVRKFFFDWYRDQAKATSAAKALVTFVTGRAWVMCDVGPNIYKFTHRTFLEYFVARRLESESESVGRLLETLYPKIIAGEWDVVSHLALQIASGNGPKAGKAVEALHILLDTNGRTSDEEFNLLVFSARALEYLAISETRFETFSQAIMDRASDLAGTASAAGIAVYSTLLARSKKKSLVHELMYADIEKKLGSGSAQSKRFARLLMGAQDLGYFRYFGGAPMGALPDYSALSHLTAPLRPKFRIKFLADALSDVDTARIYLLTYAADYERLWEQHGAELLFFRGEDHAPESYGGIRHLILEQVFENLMEKGGDDNEERREFVALVAAKAMNGGVPLRATVPQSVWAIRNSTEMGEFLVRRAYQTSTDFGHARTKALKKYSVTWRDAFAMFLTVLEFDSSYWSKKANARYGAAGEEFKRGWIVEELIPHDYFLEMLVKADQISGGNIFDDWGAARVAFLRAGDPSTVEAVNE